MDWDNYFMNLVYLTAERSKDNSTHIGAVVVDDDNTVISLGYNSFPRGIDDNKENRQERPEKYHWFAHAERNAIYNASRTGARLKGCRLYTNGTPCTDCAIGVIQSGIKEVIVDKDWDEDNREKWASSAKRSLIMFSEAGVKFRTMKPELITVRRFRRGEEF